MRCACGSEMRCVENGKQTEGGSEQSNFGSCKSRSAYKYIPIPSVSSKEYMLSANSPSKFTLRSSLVVFVVLLSTLNALDGACIVVLFFGSCAIEQDLID